MPYGQRYHIEIRWWDETEGLYTHGVSEYGDGILDTLIGVLQAYVVKRHVESELRRRSLELTTLLGHLPECGTKYRGCAPLCQHRIAEQAEGYNKNDVALERKCGPWPATDTRR